jgi:hypothetical protein
VLVRKAKPETVIEERKINNEKVHNSNSYSSVKNEGLGEIYRCLKKSFTMVFQILLCNECYKSVYT